MTTVLIVDDESSVRALLRDILEVEGYVVREAEDGPAALAAVAEYAPDAVVLDIMMPGVSGLDVLRAWRSDPQLAHLPVLLLTAADDDSTTWSGWTSGADYYLPKPFDPDHLLQWLERMLPEELRLTGGPVSMPPPYDLGSVEAADSPPAAPTSPEDVDLLRELRDLADG